MLNVNQKQDNLSFFIQYGRLILNLYMPENLTDPLSTTLVRGDYVEKIVH